MRHLFACLCALAILAPLSAQEPVTAPKQAPVITNYTTVQPTYERSGLFSRIFNRNRNTVQAYPSTAATVMPSGTATAMEPTYDRRGRITGWRTMTPGQTMSQTAVAATPMATPAVTPMTASTAMQPTYDRRGRINGWRPVEMAPMPSTAKATEMPRPTETPNGVAAAGNTVIRPENRVVQAGYTEPMPERRGIFSRIFRR